MPSASPICAVNAPSAAIDPDHTEFFPENADDLRFEMASDALGIVFAHPETDRPGSSLRQIYAASTP